MIKEKLSGIIVIGGTRTAYIVDRQIATGEITDFQDYADYCAEHYQRIIKDFIDLGGEHLQLPILGWQSFVNRGEKYAIAISQTVQMLTNDEFDTFFRQHRIYPHFVGLESLRLLPSEHYAHKMALHLKAYEETFDIDSVQHHLIWEVASIPNLTIAQSPIQTDLAGLNLKEIHDGLYDHYSRLIYGANLPIPDFYIGSARNGHIKLRATVAPALAPGSDTKFYFLKYPTILLNRENLERIMNDVRKSGLSSKQYDYDGIMNQKLLEKLAKDFQARINNNEIIGEQKKWNNS